VTLPSLHTVAEVAVALGQTERYVKEKCRLREWPHRRGARGQVGFTDEDYAEVLRLMSVEPVEAAKSRFSFAPRARRAS
jgi:hypothetical protein